MSTFPFTITAEALAYIEQRLIDTQRETRLLAYEKVLAVAFNESWTSKTGKGGWNLGPQIVIGCHSRENLDADSVELEIAGFRVLIQKADLEYLTGKHVTLIETAHWPILAVKDDNAIKWT
jgi:hypothetical protein